MMKTKCGRSQFLTFVSLLLEIQDRIAANPPILLLAALPNMEH
jgi:hypothetical protein